MPAKKPVTLLSNYFNAPGDTGSLESAGGDTVPATVAGIPQKRPNTEFIKEMKALTPVEKNYLATEVAKLTGDTVELLPV